MDEMIDQDLVKILRRGSKAWNWWREQSSPIPRIDLSGSNLSFARISEADLSGADLSGSNLTGADLRKADLTGADLRWADLSKSDLREANLTGANLSGSDLTEANLSRGHMSGVNLENALFLRTIIANVNLSKAIGLAKINHRGPSDIQLHTVKLPPKGAILHFLRGCHVPEEWIKFYLAAMMGPFQYNSCFISYAHQDETLAKRLHTDLQVQGVRCWFAPHDLHIGDKLRPRIHEAIHRHDKLLLILSKHAVNSDWIEHEVETALAREQREKLTLLFPIRLDNAILENTPIGWAALVQNERHIGDFTRWQEPAQYQSAFERMLGDLMQANDAIVMRQITDWVAKIQHIGEDENFMDLILRDQRVFDTMLREFEKGQKQRLPKEIGSRLR